MSCRTRWLPPLGVVFHSEMTCAQLLRSRHNLTHFSACLCLMKSKLQHQYLWSKIVPQRPIMQHIVNHILITEALQGLFTAFITHISSKIRIYTEHWLKLSVLYCHAWILSYHQLSQPYMKHAAFNLWITQPWFHRSSYSTSLLYQSNMRTHLGHN